MTGSRPISAVRVWWILARMSVRRRINRVQSVRHARRKRALERKRNAKPGHEESTVRSATPTKSGGISIFSIFLILLFAFNGFMLAGRGLALLSATAQNLSAIDSHLIAVTPATKARLEQSEDALRRARRLRDPVQREKYLGMWNRYVDRLLEAEVRQGTYSDEEEADRIHQMRQVFDQHGAAGFTRTGRTDFWVSSKTWPIEADARKTFLLALSLIMLLWVSLFVFGSLGTNNKDLGQVEWTFEWLSTFPVSTRALFACNLLISALVQLLVWVFLLPYFVLVYYSGGFGKAALPLGLAATVYLALLVGGLVTILEVAMRKYLSLSRLKGFQALFTLLGTGSLLLFYASSNSTLIDDFLVSKARVLPAWTLWSPFSLPLLVAANPLHVQWWVIGLMGITAALWSGFALVGSEWLTRDGLVKAGGPYQAVRRTRSKPVARNWIRGIPAHEMLLLARDRNLLVQVLVVPLMVPAYYLIVNTHLISVVSGNFRHAAMMAFAVGAYSFLNSALPVLSRDDKTLWYLLSFPQSLASILAKKAAVWAILGILYGTLTLLVIMHFSKHIHGQAWTDIVVALYGIGMYAFIGSGIGILATNVFEEVKQARFRQDMVYLYMILAAAYANAIYSPSLWAKVAQIFLSTLLAVALWQKVRDFTPYILDPTESSPREIGLADGMIAALAFFALQGLIFLILRATSEEAFSAQIAIAYVAAGIIVGGATMLILWRQGITDVWTNLGLRRQSMSAVRSSLVGAGCGLVAAAGAFAYLRLLNLFPQWQIWKQDAELNSIFSNTDKPAWLIVLAVGAAPIFEEFIFRGLVFRGLRRSTRPAVAIVGSAALFALVHPPMAVLPVFGLGLAAAISFQQTGFLLAPVVAHFVYNACVVFLGKP